MLQVGLFAGELCVLDGLLVPDTLLAVSTAELKSDSAKNVISRRLGWLSPYAIDTVIVVDNRLMSAVCYGDHQGVVVIKTNSLAQFNWVVAGKPAKPKKKLSVVDFKLMHPLLTNYFPRNLRPENIGTIAVALYASDIRPDARPTIFVTTKRRKR